MGGGGGGQETISLFTRLCTEDCFILSPMGQSNELIMFRSTRSQQIIKTLVTVICVVRSCNKSEWIFYKFKKRSLQS